MAAHAGMQHDDAGDEQRSSHYAAEIRCGLPWARIAHALGASRRGLGIGGASEESVVDTRSEYFSSAVTLCISTPGSLTTPDLSWLSAGSAAVDGWKHACAAAHEP